VPLIPLFAADTAVATPTGFTATAGRRVVDMTWAAVSGATSYRVYRDGVLIGSPSDPAWVDHTGVVGTSYSYTVSAVGSGESAQTAALSRASTALPAVSASASAFRTALPAAATTPVRMMTVGDSIAEGYGASPVASRWLDRFTAATRVSFQPSGVAGGVGFLPPDYISSGLAGPATFGGAPAIDGTLGLGGRSVELNTAGESATWTVSGTSVDVIYATAPGTGAFTVSIDGGAATTVTTTTTAGSPLVDAAVQRFTFATRGTHTVAVARSTGACYVSGLIVYDQDEAAGIRTYDGSRSGWSSRDYLLAQEKINQHPLADHIARIDPQLVVVNLATNDWLHSESVVGFRQNLVTLMGLLGTTRSVVFQPAYLTDRTGEAAAEYAPWQQYVATMYAVANAYSNVTVVDLSALMPPVVGDTQGYYADQYHPNNTGHQRIADLMAAALLPASGGTAGSAALSGSGSLTAPGAPRPSTTAALSGAGSLTAPGTPRPAATAALTGSGSLNAPGAPRPAATAALTGSGALTAAVAPRPAGDVALAGSGSLTSTSTPALLAPAALTGDGSLTASGVATSTATTTAALTGSGALTATAVPGSTAPAALTGTGTLAGTTAPDLETPVALSGAGQLTGTAAPVPLLTISLTGAGTLNPSGRPAVTAPAALSGTGTLTTTGSATTAGGTSISLTGAGALTAVPRPALPLAAALTGAGQLTAAPAPAVLRAAALTGSGTLTAAASQAAQALAALTGSGSLLAAGNPRATLTGSGSLTALALLTAARLALLTGSGRLTVLDVNARPPGRPIPVTVLGPYRTVSEATGPYGQVTGVRGPCPVPVNLHADGPYGDSADVTGPTAPTVLVTGPRS
jgi:lysophospholipase L1-like esterase